MGAQEHVPGHSAAPGRPPQQLAPIEREAQHQRF
jgi:hypothetical protein